MTDEDVAAEVALRLSDETVESRRSRLNAGLKQAKEDAERLEGQRRYLISRLELNKDLSLQQRRDLLEQIQTLEAAVAISSDDVEAFRTAAQELPPRPRPVATIVRG